MSSDPLTSGLWVPPGSTALAGPGRPPRTARQIQAAQIVREWLTGTLDMDRECSDALAALDPEDRDGDLIDQGLGEVGRHLDAAQVERITYLIYSLGYMLARSNNAPQYRAGDPCSTVTPNPYSAAKFGDWVRAGAQMVMCSSDFQAMSAALHPKPAAGESPHPDDFHDYTDYDEPDEGGELR